MDLCDTRSLTRKKAGGNNISLTSVSIPACATKIGDNAFGGFTSLTETR